MKHRRQECIRCTGSIPPETFFCPTCYPGTGNISFQDAIVHNKRASFLLTALLISSALILGFIIGNFQGHPLAGIMLAMTILAILTIVTMTSGRDIPLLVNGASRADRDTEKLLTNVIDELKLASGLMETPEIYVINDDSINAFASALSEKEAAIAVTRGAVNRLTRDELQGVLAHEISHILSRDSRYFLFLSVIVGSVLMISDLFLRIGFLSRRTRLSFGWFIPAILLALFAPLFITILRFAISRKREFLADAKAVSITRNPTALATALEKTAHLGSRIRGVNRATRHMFILNPQGAIGGNKPVLFSTHPPLEERIKRLKMMGARF